MYYFSDHLAGLDRVLISLRLSVTRRLVDSYVRHDVAPRDGVVPPRIQALTPRELDVLRAATSTCTGTTRSSFPTWPGPAVRYAIPMPAMTTKTANRRPTGAELPTSRRAVPDVRAP